MTHFSGLCGMWRRSQMVGEMWVVRAAESSTNVRWRKDHDGNGMRNLAVLMMMAGGDEVVQDVGRAAKLFEPAIEEHDDVGSMVGLRWVPSNGAGGVDTDVVRAVELYELGCRRPRTTRRRCKRISTMSTSSAARSMPSPRTGSRARAPRSTYAAARRRCSTPTSSPASCTPSAAASG